MVSDLLDCLRYIFISFALWAMAYVILMDKSDCRIHMERKVALWRVILAVIIAIAGVVSFCYTAKILYG